MTPRKRRRRRVGRKPGFTQFGPTSSSKKVGEVVLTVDELESIRLKDLENLTQEEAAEKMDISQPTFHRTLLSARKKISDALINGKAIKVEGGNYWISPNKNQG
ncbi:MAG: DUF134 domain-containing protein [Hadesarchaea archaeon]|nr:DUF134 domain-containing protein [Hadesarchaea archaeon]